MVTVVGHQFITLTVDNCVQHGRREAPPRAGLSAAAENCLVQAVILSSSVLICLSFLVFLYIISNYHTYCSVVTGSLMQLILCGLSGTYAF